MGAARSIERGDAQALQKQMRLFDFVDNCCHRRDGWNGTSTVNFCLAWPMRSNNGRSAKGIRTENARASVPSVEGNVILFSLKSMQLSGNRVSRNRQPVPKEMLKPVCIRAGVAVIVNL
jgi:hypothetical protein